MEIAIWRTGHEISDTVCTAVSRAIGARLMHVSDAEHAKDFEVNIAYGILRGTEKVFVNHWFEIDKGLWDAAHYEGLYRMSYKSTQPIYRPTRYEAKDFIPLQDKPGHVLILPPTDYVASFFGIDQDKWLKGALIEAELRGKEALVRKKLSIEPVDWRGVSLVVTFNSSMGFDALSRDIPVLSDPDHSTIGSFCRYKKDIYNYDRNELVLFASAHQFKLGDKDRICSIIKSYL